MILAIRFLLQRLRIMRPQKANQWHDAEKSILLLCHWCVTGINDMTGTSHNQPPSATLRPPCTVFNIAESFKLQLHRNQLEWDEASL